MRDKNGGGEEGKDDYGFFPARLMIRKEVCFF